MTVERTFVFADLAGYTALTEAHGDDDAATVATRFHDLARACLPTTTRLVKTIGDAVMLAAPTISEGISAALAILVAVAGERSFPSVRIGIHAGPAVERDGDFFGANVNLAARVAGVARGGEVVCTETVAAAAVEQSLAGARPIGTMRLKNVAVPVALFELGGGDANGGPLRHVDPVCRMLIAPDEAVAETVHAETTLYFCSLACATRFKSDPEAHLPHAPEPER